MTKSGILIFIGIIAAFNSYSGTRIAITSGNWEVTSTWAGGILPACGDSVVIGAGYSVQITTLLDFSACSQAMFISVSGTLSFQTGKKLKLPCSSNIEINTGGQVTAGGGGGNSNLIDICGTTVWNTAQGNLSGPITLTLTPLPIELAYFSGKPGNDEIILNWITYSEKNNSYFTVEKGKDGIHFQDLTNVPGGGTTPVLNSYTTIDKNPLEGVQYYRLRQTDYNGNSTLSNTIAIRFNYDLRAHIYPNPTSGELFANVHPDLIGQSAQLMINTSDGKIHLRKDIEITELTYGIKLLQPNETLRSGSYLVTLRFRNQSFVQYIISKQ